MKKEFFEALTGDVELVSLVGTMRGASGGLPCIFFDAPGSFNDLPAVSFFEKESADLVFADDECIAGNIVMQVDVWAKAEVSAVCGAVDRVARELGYHRHSCADVPDPNIQHITAMYKKFKFKGGF